MFFQLVTKFPSFLETLSLLSASQEPTTSPHPEPVQSNPRPLISSRYIYILSNILLQGLLSSHFPSGFSTKTMNTFLFTPIRATFPTNIMRKTRAEHTNTHILLQEAGLCDAGADGTLNEC